MMHSYLSATEYWHAILKEKGQETAQQAKNVLLRDPSLSQLREPLEFISENWSDPLRPALMNLSYEAVGGNSTDTKEVAITLCLINLCSYLWDDLIDEAKTRMFKPTFVGKYGPNNTLLIGGLTAAKAYDVLNQQNIDQTKRSAISTEIWQLWAGMISAEIKSLHARKTQYHAKDKLEKIKKECETNLATCTRIGTILGNGTKKEIRHLGNYGKYIGIIIDLRNDLRVTANLTIELSKKITTGALPYSLLWAKEHNKTTANLLAQCINKNQIGPEDLQKIVDSTLKANVLSKIRTLTSQFTKKALAELAELKQNPATQTLKTLAEVQPHLLLESLL
jgi:geranylgeranyl diphosphate synthase, type I